MFEGKLTFERMNDRAFWARMAPRFHIEDPALFSADRAMPVDELGVAMRARRLKTEGYFEIHEPPWSPPLADMRALVIALTQQGLPPAFAFVYDEFWAMFHALHRVVEPVLGPNYHRLPDFWVWHIDPATAQSGWEPHRDKPTRALFDDGMPQSLTIWIPLTEATPLNGCMYVVPADRDPNYGKPPAPMNFRYQDIRALPGEPGDVFAWNHCLLHWGARSSPRAAGPRISMAMEFQSAAVKAMNSPVSNALECPRFKFRLKLIGKQILQYKHMYALSPELEKLALRL